MRLITLLTKDQALRHFKACEIHEPLPTVNTRVIQALPNRSFVYVFKKEKHGRKWFYACYQAKPEEL